jgi:hypothetical protein
MRYVIRSDTDLECTLPSCCHMLKEASYHLVDHGYECGICHEQGARKIMFWRLNGHAGMGVPGVDFFQYQTRADSASFSIRIFGRRPQLCGIVTFLLQSWGTEGSISFVFVSVRMAVFSSIKRRMPRRQMIILPFPTSGVTRPPSRKSMLRERERSNSVRESEISSRSSVGTTFAARTGFGWISSASINPQTVPSAFPSSCKPSRKSTNPVVLLEY